MQSVLDANQDVFERLEEGVAQRLRKTGIFEDLGLEVEDCYVTILSEESADGLLLIRLSLELSSGEVDEDGEEALSDTLNEQFFSCAEDYLVNGETDALLEKAGPDFSSFEEFTYFKVRTED